MKEIFFDFDIDERGLVLTITRPDYVPGDYKSYCDEIKLIKMIEKMEVEWKNHCNKLLKKNNCC